MPWSAGGPFAVVPPAPSSAAIVYLHGFQGSPQSAKARLLGADLARCHPGVRYLVPGLSFDPQATIDILTQTLDSLAAEGYTAPLVVGSSMGGFYAALLAARHGLRAVLVNPVVRAHELWAARLGPVSNPYTGESRVLCAQDVAVLRDFASPPPARPQDLLVLLQTGDETLDWRQAATLYADCSLLIQRGGNHAFEHFEDTFPLIYRFAGLQPSA